MATEILNITYAPAVNVFYVVRNPLNDQVLDHSDATFKALGSATTPGLAATEKSAFGGVGESGYQASLDLDDVNATPTVMQFLIEAYIRAGGSVNLANDTLLDTGEICVASGSRVSASPGSVAPGYVVRVGMNVTATDGSNVQLYAWVERDGQPVTVDGECLFECYAYGGTVAQWEVDSVTENAIGQYEATRALPNFTNNTKYLLRATITVGTTELVGQWDLPVIGGA